MEEVSYTTFVEKLNKLQRNESQMTDEQKVEYADQLKALRHKISGMASEIAKGYVLGGAQLKKGEDAGECARQMLAIARSEKSRVEYKRATEVLFSTYSLERFLEALLPIHYRVWYEGYAPYWCKHCKTYTGKSYTGKPLTFWNDITEMGWSEENGLWYREDMDSVSRSLPPTMEKVKEEYNAEVQVWTMKIAPTL